MARQTFRANLSASQFPLVSDSYGQSVVVAQQDENYIRPNAFTGLEADHNIGIPQILYAENVLPFSTGFQSIGFSNPIPGGVGNDFDQMFYLRDSAENRTLFSPAGGKCYIFSPATGAWTSNPIAPPPGAICSVSSVKQRTFVCFSNHANFLEWNGAALVNVALTALNPINIRGLTNSAGFNIAWDYNTIFWSSSIDVTDFTPSLSTGAGSQQVVSQKGRIVYCKQIEDGFVIHTTVNAIVAKYSGNIRFPWVFSELKGSGGISSPDDVCDSPDGTQTYVYGNDGFMVYDRVKGTTVFPEVTEFLCCGRYETYNRATGNLDLTKYTAKLKTKITFVGSRWLVMSYGLGISGVMNHALVYDTTLKRWGKITTDHVDCFEYNGDVGDSTVTGGQIAWAGVPGPWNFENNPWVAWGSVQSVAISGNTVPYRALGFLAQDGHVRVADFNWDNVDGLGIMYLGRFQFVRGKLTTVLDVVAEGTGAANLTLDLLTSYDGRNVSLTTQPRLMNTSSVISKWQTKKTGLNHVLRFRGGFQLNTVILKTMLNGER